MKLEEKEIDSLIDKYNLEEYKDSCLKSYLNYCETHDTGWDKDYSSMIAENFFDGYSDGLRQAEKEVAHEVAQKMFNMGMATDVIENATGLTTEEIKSITK